MKCPACGFENRENAKFCAGCAAPLKRTCAGCGAEIYGWFTDTSAGGLRSAGGFDTRDLKEAKVLLEEMS